MSEIESSTKPTECVGVICFRGDDVLLIQRGTAPRKGEWSIPGGRIEVGEAEADAALRELFEETGIKARLGPKVEVIDTVFEGVSYRLHDYAAIWLSGEPSAGDDAAQAKFVPLSTISQFGMWPKTESIIRDSYRLLSEQKSLSQATEGA